MSLSISHGFEHKQPQTPESNHGGYLKCSLPIFSPKWRQMRVKMHKLMNDVTLELFWTFSRAGLKLSFELLQRKRTRHNKAQYSKRNIEIKYSKHTDRNVRANSAYLLYADTICGAVSQNRRGRSRCKHDTSFLKYNERNTVKDNVTVPVRRLFVGV